VVRHGVEQGPALTASITTVELGDPLIDHIRRAEGCTAEAAADPAKMHAPASASWLRR
jgi:hypothetical protein